MNQPEYFLIIGLVSFIIGSIPWGFILGKLLKNKDIRTQGSGNIGTTNAFRTSGPAVGVLTLILDFFKGWIPCLVAGRLMGDEVLIAITGLCAVLGHCYSVFLSFKGGKGIASSAGVIAYFDYRVLLVLLTVFILVLLAGKIVSLASISAAIAAPITGQLLSVAIPYRIVILMLALLVIFRHQANIQRLRAGTESKIFSGKHKK